MIRTSGLTKSYGTIHALRDLTITVEPGEIVGLLGPNGAGKSTTARILTGLLLPTSGTAHVSGINVADDPRAVKRKVGYLPESPTLFDHLTPSEFMTFVSRLRELEPTVANQRRQELFELFGLNPVGNMRLSGLSKGVRQRVLLCATLIHRPQILILDEPLDGLDVESVILVKALLRGFAQTGKTVVISSHMVDVVEATATRVLIIKAGRQVMSGSPGELCAATQSATLEQAFLRIVGMADPHERTEVFLKRFEAHADRPSGP